MGFSGDIDREITAAEESLRVLGEKMEGMLAVAAEGGRELLDKAESIAPYLERFKTAMDFCDWIRLKYLLFGLRNGGDMEKKLRQLERYVSSRKRAEYVVSAFRQALLSRSHIVNTVIGLQLSKVSARNADVTQMDMLIFDALCSFNDFDVRNYKDIYETTLREPLKTSEGDFVNTPLLEKREDFEDLFLTLAKSERAGLFTYRSRAFFEGEMELSSFYKLNRASGLFYEMLCEAESLFDGTTL